MFRPKDNKFWALYLKPEGITISPNPEPLVEKVLAYIRDRPGGIPFEDIKDDFDMIQIDCKDRTTWKMKEMNAWTFMAIGAKMGLFVSEGVKTK